MKRGILFLVVFIFLIGLVSATDYYLDAVNGNDDTGDGSFSNPFQSFSPVSSFDAAYMPANHVNLQPGDTIYLMSGVYDDVFQCCTIGTSEAGFYVGHFEGLYGNEANQFTIKAYPGEYPIVDPGFASEAIRIRNSAWWNVEGIEIRNAYQRGLYFYESRNMNAKNLIIHDTDGDSGENCAGLYINLVYNVDVDNCTLYDNYDRAPATNEQNSMDLVIFSSLEPYGGNISIHNCNFYQTPSLDEVSGGCLKNKHASADPNTFLHIYNNTFTNCKFHAIGTGTQNTYAHHNLIYGGSYAFRVRNFGGLTHLWNILFEHNTFYGSSAQGIIIESSAQGVNADFPDDIFNVTFRKNILYDSGSSYVGAHPDTGSYTMVGLTNKDDYSINQVEWASMYPDIHFSENCYYNPNTPLEFTVFFDSGDALYNFAQWQQLEGQNYDINSFNTNPLFMSTDPSSPNYLRPQSGSPCEGMGYYADQLPSASDVNSDGVVNVVDLVLTTFWQGKIDSDLDWSWYDHLDVNLDGSVNWGDVIDVLGSI